MMIPGKSDEDTGRFIRIRKDMVKAGDKEHWKVRQKFSKFQSPGKLRQRKSRKALEKKLLLKKFTGGYTVID